MTFVINKNIYIAEVANFRREVLTNKSIASDPSEHRQNFIRN